MRFRGFKILKSKQRKANRICSNSSPLCAKVYSIQNPFVLKTYLIFFFFLNDSQIQIFLTELEQVIQWFPYVGLK